MVLGIKSRILNMLGVLCATQLHPQVFNFLIFAIQFCIFWVVIAFLGYIMLPI